MCIIRLSAFGRRDSKRCFMFSFAIRQPNKTTENDTIANAENASVVCVPEYLRL